MKKSSTSQGRRCTVLFNKVISGVMFALYNLQMFVYLLSVQDPKTLCNEDEPW